MAILPAIDRALQRPPLHRQKVHSYPPDSLAQVAPPPPFWVPGITNGAGTMHIEGRISFSVLCVQDPEGLLFNVNIGKPVATMPVSEHNWH
ncbi:hypothetical protein VE04_07079, partial [Pseudogymnoascus sp. 24MN13]